MIESLVHAVGNGAVIEKRSEHLVHGRNDIVQAADVEKRFLLSCKRRVGQVLRGGRGTHCHGDVAATAHFRPGRFDVLLQPRWQWRVQYPASDRFAGLGQRRNVVDIEAVQHTVDTLVELFGGKKLAIRGCRGRESARYRNAEVVEIADHFAERGVLSADGLNVVHTKLGEPDDVWFQVLLPCVRVLEMDNRTND